MKKLLCIAPMALAAGLLLAGNSMADDDHRLDDAWKAEKEESEGILTDKQSAALNVLAYEAAVARLCDGFKLDEAKYSAGVSSIVADKDSKLSEEEQMQRLSSVLFALGTAHGILLAEGASKRPEFCADAEKAKADKEHNHNWQ